VTTIDISKLLGISRATVSRALNNNPCVKPETREKVMRVVEEYRYIPNQAARSLIMRKQLKVGVVVFSQPLSFWERIRRGVDQAITELAHTGVQIDYFITDIMHPEAQADLINQLVVEGYHGIALTPNDPLIMGDVIDKAIAAGIAVVLFNVDISNVNRLAYVGSDYITAGKLAAEIISKTICGGKGNVAIITLEKQILPIEQRTTGFRLGLADYPDVAITHVCRFPRIGGSVYERTQKLLTTEKIDAIFVPTAVLGDTAKAIFDLRLNGRVSLVGYDIDKEIAGYLKNGTITATIGHEAQAQSYQALSILCAYLYNGTKPRWSLNYTKLEVIMRHNMHCYI
jgi:LacI family transcriptional regulator